MLHNYILYQGELDYIQNFPVNLGMPLIFSHFQHCTCLRPTSYFKICEYQSHQVVQLLFFALLFILVIIILFALRKEICFNYH